MQALILLIPLLFAGFDRAGYIPEWKLHKPPHVALQSYELPKGTEVIYFVTY